MNKDAGVIVFDFDNTLTVTDTVKFAVMALALRFPWKLPRALGCFRAAKKTNLSAENVKHAVIGVLIKGTSPSSVNGAMVSYHCLVSIARNRPMWSLMLHHKNNGDIVLIATASPQFAVERVVRRYSLPVIGTEYEIKGDLFTGNPILPVPFGGNKAVKLAAYLKRNGFSSIDKAYSDSTVDMPILKMAREAYLVDKSGRLTEVI